MPGLNFSFSGIKTAFLYFLRDHVAKEPDFIKNNINDICASLQHSLVAMLMQKLKRASNETGIREIAIAGGVSANSGLRNELRRLAEEKKWNVYIPEFQYCTDNAGMIAMAAHYKYLNGNFSPLDISPMARMKI